MFVTNWILTTKIQKISEITNFFRHYFLSRTEVHIQLYEHPTITPIRDYRTVQLYTYPRLSPRKSQFFNIF